MAVWCTLSQFGTPRPGMTLPCRFSYTWFSFYMWHTLYCGVRILSWYSTGTLFGNAVIRLAASWFDVPREAQINRLSSFDITSLKVQANIVCRAAKTTVTTHTRRAKINIIERLVQIFRDSCNAVLNGEVRTTRKNILTIFRIGDTCLVEADLFKSKFLEVYGSDIFVQLTMVHTTTSPNPINNVDHVWPQKVPFTIKNKCYKKYRDSTMWERPPCCAVCARERFKATIWEYHVPGDAVEPMDGLELLRLTDKYIIQHCIVSQCSPEFFFGNHAIDSLMLVRSGVDVDPNTSDATIQVCNQCHASLSSKPRPKLPKFALKNRLYRGRLPDEFQDLTWIEEKVCAIYRASAYVTRLYHSDDPRNPHVFHGNTCAHWQNVISTATVLPRTPADINDMLSIVFVGPRTTVPASCLKNIFRIRKEKVRRFLQWLALHNHLYSQLTIDESIFDLYDNDNTLPGVEDRIIFNQTEHAREIFEQDTAGISAHPASQLYTSESAHDPDTTVHVMLESTGISDPDGACIPARNIFSAALRNTARVENTPDLYLHRSSNPVPEYSNPDLIPGMFPTLFPFGIGGFEDSMRQEPISFRIHADYCFDLQDRSFRYHRSFMFVALNIFQRHASHLHSAFTIKKSNYDKVAEKLVSLTPDLIESVARHVENEGKLTDLSPQQKSVLTLLNEVNAVSANIPGSSASKLKVRNDIRAYMGYFGLPHLYMTLNPNASHSPIFQVMYGDEAVDLSARYPELIQPAQRAIRLAQDPVAAADFFEFSIENIFRHLLGWDYEKQRSTETGGIFGRLRAYYGTAEFTERGQLHGHFLLWLDGGLNPSDVHTKMKLDSEWRDQFFEFFEDIIHHHLPDTDDVLLPNYEPRTQRPPDPDDPAFDADFIADVKLSGEALQRHICRDVCHKYGHVNDCRFLFPHEIVEHSYFDENTNSIILKCLDGTINYYNPLLLVCCRHNHDLKCILSGKSAKAAMFYISDYITKNDEKMHQVLTMLSKAVAAVPSPESEQ